MDYRQRVTQLLEKIKSGEADKSLSGDLFFLSNKDSFTGQLHPLTKKHLCDEGVIEKLALWREKSQLWFPSQFRVTLEGTKKWMQEQLLDKEDRILFFVSVGGDLLGHVGLYRFRYHERSCELDNVIRGEDALHKGQGVMAHACHRLITWCFHQLEMNNVDLRVFSDNVRAITLYQKLGFKEIQRVPLTKVVKDGASFWEEVVGNPYLEVNRYFVTMRMTKGDLHG